MLSVTGVGRSSSSLRWRGRLDLEAVVDEEVVEERSIVDEGLPPILGGSIAVVEPVAGPIEAEGRRWLRVWTADTTGWVIADAIDER